MQYDNDFKIKIIHFISANKTMQNLKSFFTTTKSLYFSFFEGEIFMRDRAFESLIQNVHTYNVLEGRDATGRAVNACSASFVIE